jgi:hypothetical protein
MSLLLLVLRRWLKGWDGLLLVFVCRGEGGGGADTEIEATTIRDRDTDREIEIDRNLEVKAGTKLLL